MELLTEAPECPNTHVTARSIAEVFIGTPSPIDCFLLWYNPHQTGDSPGISLREL